MTELPLTEIALRLGTAVLCGLVIGINRDMHAKPVGARTLGLVALGSALTTMCAANLGDPSHSTVDAVSRAIQGLVTGIGFLGAGVIIKNQRDGEVQGITTAATIWVVVAFGIVCALGNWRVAGVAVAISIMLLIVGRPLEALVQRVLPGSARDRRE